MCARFIPAYAGNAPSRSSRNRARPVHPRIRGERAKGRFPSATRTGSSPHTRGTRGLGAGSRIGRRFIPAYAGNASGLSLTRGIQSVHPRIRGERLDLHQKRHCTSGSSPHTRGTLLDGGGVCHEDRFIPAYAGNASQSVFTSKPSVVHPRIRGERSWLLHSVLLFVGSSPHTRGTPGGLAAAIGATTVHPRIRGERGKSASDVQDQLGSSPHTRGTRRDLQNAARKWRFIPAYAGNAFSRPQPTSR